MIYLAVRTMRLGVRAWLVSRGSRRKLATSLIRPDLSVQRPAREVPEPGWQAQASQCVQFVTDNLKVGVMGRVTCGGTLVRRHWQPHDRCHVVGSMYEQRDKLAMA